MTRPRQPATLEARVVELERQLRALNSGGSRAEHTTIQAGATRVRDMTGNIRAVLGDINDDGQSYGLAIPQGGVIVIRDEDGTIRLVLGDALGDSDAYGMTTYQGGQITVLDTDEHPRAVMGDLLGDSTQFGFATYEGGVHLVLDGDGIIRALVGDVNGDGTTFGVQLLRGGMQEVRDSTGDLRVRIGDLDGITDPTGDGNFGVTITDGDGNSRFWADNDGLHNPELAMHVLRFGDVEEVEVDEFTPTWQVVTSRISHRGVKVQVPWLVEGGIEGEIQLLRADDLTTTDTATVGDVDEDGFVEFAWLHDVDLNLGPITFVVMARVSSGTGVLKVFRPPFAVQVGAEQCTASGLPDPP